MADINKDSGIGAVMNSLRDALDKESDELPVTVPATPYFEDDIALAVHQMPGIRLLTMCNDIVGNVNGPHLAIRMFEWSVKRLTR